jgi:hypothetical protein
MRWLRDRDNLLRDCRGRLDPCALDGRVRQAAAGAQQVAKVDHHPALAIDEMPSFMAVLRQQSGAGAKAPPAHLDFYVSEATRRSSLQASAGQSHCAFTGLSIRSAPNFL